MKRLDALRQLRSTLGAEVFLVGGTVRDLIRRKTPRDLDVLVRNVTPADFQEFLAKRGSLQLVGDSFGVYLFKPKGAKEGIEIAFPRTEVSTGPGHREFTKVSDPTLSLEEDSRRRDFTLNAMYLDIDNVGTGKRW
jgi:tRNA nucleotidyltransferase (CCA-adding enzyme)